MTTPTDSTPLPPPLLARAQAAQVATDEANARKAASDADTSALTLAQTQYKSLVPNLTGVATNTVSDKSTGVAFSGLVTYSALNHAAEILANRISKTLNAAAEANQATILVTSQSDLLTNDLLWSTVKSGLNQLIAFADQVLKAESPSAAESEKPAQGDEALVWPFERWPVLQLERQAPLAAGFAGGFGRGLTAAGAATLGTGAFGPIGLAAAAAAAVPSIISLFSSTATVKDHHEDITDLATTTSVMAAVAESLPGCTVVHEDFRLAPTTSAIRLRYEQLAARRTALLFRQDQVQVIKNEAELALARAQHEQDAAKKAQPRPDPAKVTRQQDAGSTAPQEGVPPGTAPPLDLSDPIVLQIDAATAVSASAAAELALISGAITSIDSFCTAVNTTAAGTRSPLAIAILNELLHQKGADAIRYVLSVKGLGGQSEEYTKDRHVGFDTYTTLADAAVSFMLYDTANRKIVCSGVANGVSSVHGRLGEPPTGLQGPNSASAIDDLAADGAPPDGGHDQQAEQHRPWWRRIF